jgi:23S rRNA (cytosine1962-C5)-methyltransferase
MFAPRDRARTARSSNPLLRRFPKAALSARSRLLSSSVRHISLHRKDAAERLVRGHPWVWRDAIATGLEGAAAGEEVQVVAPGGTLVGRGLADPGSPIAVRMWTHGKEPIDARLWQARVALAVSLRVVLVEGTGTDAYRMVHGEGDRMPGMVVDRYGIAAIVRADGDGAAAHVSTLVDALWPIAPSLGIKSLALRTGDRGETPCLEPLRGPPPPDSVRITEHGVPFVVDLLEGQKTGAFLDQRDNRRRVGQLASGRRVLNLYSYAGGFSVCAALGGATHVTSVDIAPKVHATAQANFRVAGLEPRAHAFTVADVPGFLEGVRGQGEKWDLIISDPPSFASSERAKPRALAAYRALHRACAEVLAPRGLLCAASCSSHVDAGAFLATLDDAALGGRVLRVLEMHGAGPDHPWLAAFPEGRYLKFALLG